MTASATIIVLSVNHQLAPVNIREQVVFNKTDITAILSALYQEENVEGCAILSTCNRSEVFISSKSILPQSWLIKWFADCHKLEVDKISPYLVFFSGQEAINHISNVASGLDSLILGEPQILGQLKETYHLAKSAKVLDKILEKLFQHAFSTAKYIRTHTKIGNSPVSVAYCGVKLAQQIFSKISEQTVLLIGANEMITLSVEHFLNQGVSEFIIVNRTVSKAQTIANKINASNNNKADAVGLSHLHHHLHRADIIITSTASPVPILGKGLIETALKQRKRKPIFILDIAVPRDVEPEVSQLEDIYLYTVDDLEQVVAQNKESREQEKQIAQQLVVEKTLVFEQWLASLPNELIIKDYRHIAIEVKTTLTSEALKKIEQGADVKTTINTLADQLTNKLLHQTFSNIKTMPADVLPHCDKCKPNI